MNQNLSFLVDSKAQQLSNQGVSLFAKFPHLPKNWVEFFAKIMPYLILIAGVSSIFAGLQNFFTFTPLHRWTMGLIKLNRSFYYVNGLFEIVTGVLYLLAYDGLKKKNLDGWLILFWTTVLGVLRSAVSLFFGWNSIFGLLLSALIGFWFIYEMRSEYLPKTTVAKKSPAKKTTTKKKS